MQLIPPKGHTRHNPRGIHKYAMMTIITDAYLQKHRPKITHKLKHKG